MKIFSPFLCLFLCVHVFATPARVETATIYSLSLPSLTENNAIAFDDYQGHYILVSMFAPNCSWCHKQMKAFNEIHQNCDSIKTFSVGINGTPNQLRKELRKAQVSYPALRATHEWIQTIGDVPATPWTFLFDQQGTLVTTLRGYIPYSKVEHVFPEQCHSKRLLTSR